MSGKRSTVKAGPTLAHAEAKARRDLDYLEQRFRQGKFNCAPEAMRWQIDTQRLIVATIAAQLPAPAPSGAARACPAEAE